MIAGTSKNMHNPTLMEVREHLKEELISYILKIIQDRHLTQTEAAIILQTNQPEISKLKNGLSHRFRVERLFHFINLLDVNIDIYLSLSKENKAHQKIIIL